MTDSRWRVGDSVSLCPNGNESDRVSGTVTAIDEVGLPRGVRVRLDRVVRGVDNAYASHNELTLVRRFLALVLVLALCLLAIPARADDGQLDRGEAALHISAVLTFVGYDWPDGEGRDFSDLDGIPSDQRRAVRLLAGAGWVYGTSEGRYQPDALFSRGHVALILDRIIADGPLPPDVDDTEPFADTQGTRYDRPTRTLRATEVSVGCTERNYCPAGTLTQTQLGLFMQRGADRGVYPGQAEPVPMKGETGRKYPPSCYKHHKNPKLLICKSGVYEAPDGCVWQKEPEGLAGGWVLWCKS